MSTAILILAALLALAIGALILLGREVQRARAAADWSDGEMVKAIASLEESRAHVATLATTVAELRRDLASTRAALADARAAAEIKEMPDADLAAEIERTALAALARRTAGVPPSAGPASPGDGPGGA